MRFSLDLSHQEEIEDEEVQAAAAQPSISGEEGFIDDVEATATSNSRITPGATPSPSSFPLGAHTNHQRRKKKQKNRQRQDEEDDDDNGSKASSSSSRSRGPKGVTSLTVASVILILGCAATGAFWTIGVLQAIGDSQKAFEYDVERLAHRMHSAFREYESAGLWVQQSCSSHHYEHSSDNDGGNHSSSSPYAPNFRSYFRELYEAVVAQDLPLYAIEYVPNVTHEERPWYEQEAKQFYQSFYPGLAVHYNGFSGVTEVDPEDDHHAHNHGKDEHNHNMPAETTFELAPLPDNVADFYYPIHFVEPIEGNEEVIDIDIYNFMPSSQRIIDMALDTMQSHITGRMRLLQEPDPSPDAYSVLLIHPGRPSTNPYDQTGTYNFRGDVSIITIRIPELLEFMAEQDHLYDSLQTRLPNMQVYLFDSTPDNDSEMDDDQPVFLGAAELHKHETKSMHGTDDDDKHAHMFHSNEYYEPLPEVSYEELTGRTDVRIHIESILVGQRNWTIACIAGDESYPSGATLSILAGAMILIAFICLAMWIHALMNRAALESRLKSKAQEEQSLLRIDHARQAAAAERQLNEFIAHEVRNPLAAAMSACSFVTSALQQESEVEEAAVKAKARQKALKNNNNNRPSTARQVVPLPNSNSNSNNTQQPKKETLAVPAPLFQIPPPPTSPSPQQQRTSAINPMTSPTNNGPNNNSSPLFSIPVAPSSPTISASASGTKPAPLFSITPSSPSTAGRASVAPSNNISSANTAAQTTALSGNGSKPAPLFSINPTSNANGQNTAPNENGNNKPAPLFSIAPSNNTAQNATPTTTHKEQGNKPAPLFSIAPSRPNSSSNVQNNLTSDGSERPAPLFSIMAPPPPASSPAANQEQANKPAPLYSIMPNKNPAAASTNQQTSTTTDGPSSIPAPLFSLAPSTTTITPKKKDEHNNSNSAPAPLFSLMSAPEAPLDASMSSLPAMPMVSNLETREAILADCHIIDSSLQFINDLLRNMLDVQRAACHQLNIEKGPTDVLHDILEPVEAMLYMRGRSVEVQLDYDENDMNFLVETDRLRLKQVVLNLGRNAAKFVEKGYVRFCVKVVPATVPYPQQEVKKGKRRSILKSANSSNGDCIEQALGGQETVQIWIEDTGPGIPESKKQNLFGKFQESLDTLSQGTGLGLSLVKIICRLMGGEVWLDESYHSGFDDRPGARFIIDLHTPPMRVEDSTHNNVVAVEGDIEAQAAGAGFVHLRKGSDSGTATESTHSLQSIPPGLPVQETLPVTLSVLMVDDDSVLRKLLVRAVRGICPGWAIQEAASGEAALRLIDQDQTFDLIFMDQYMASMQKQLLGTEATRALRSKGVKAKICGLSANEMARDFFAAGADAFVCKPMPTKKETMKQVLLDILGEDQQSERAPYRRQRSSLVITPANVR